MPAYRLHPIRIVQQIRLLAESLDCDIEIIPRNRLTECQRDCLRVIEQSYPDPVTKTRILSRLEEQGVIWAARTVEGALSDLVRMGRIRSSKRSPRGYTLANPD